MNELMKGMLRIKSETLKGRFSSGRQRTEKNKKSTERTSRLIHER